MSSEKQAIIDQLKAMLEPVGTETSSYLAIQNGEDTVDEYAGGNIDDAYSLGESHGTISTAHWILGILNTL